MMMPRRQGLSKLENCPLSLGKSLCTKRGQAPEIQEFGFAVRKTESNRQIEQVRPAGIERQRPFARSAAGQESGAVLLLCRWRVNNFQKMRASRMNSAPSCLNRDFECESARSST